MPSNAGGQGGVSTALSGCGIACDAANPCTGQGMACLPAAKGGTVCKPASCPACAAGTFCAYNNSTCEPTGCTSDACGFPYTGACDGCVKSHCCQQNLVCSGDPACASMVQCAAACSGSACVSACEQGNASAAAELNAAFSCEEAQCPSECYGTTAAPPVADAGTGPVSCDFLSSCVSVVTTNSTVVCAERGGVQVVLTNNCGEAIYCQLGVQDPLPPTLGASTSSPAPSTGVVQPAGILAIQGCDGATQSFSRCVPATQAVACLDAPPPSTGTTTTPPTTTPGRACPTSFSPGSVDPQCLASLDASCCAQETACAADTICVECSTNLGDLVQCQTDAALQALTSCKNGLGLVCEGGA